MPRVLKSTIVIIGAITCSTLLLQAGDSIRGVPSALPALVSIGSRDAVCPPGMTPLKMSGSSLCVDTHEVSTGEGCHYRDPSSSLQTEENMNVRDCLGVSEPGAVPWRFVSQTQAERICAKSGKRLPTNEEWYRAAMGTESSPTCNLNGDVRQRPSKTGSSACVSSIGAHDMIGNVWEWVDAQVTNGEYRGRSLPSEGHISSIDRGGVALKTTSTPQVLYSKDYFWMETEEEVSGMIRGGFYGSREDGGLYALNAAVSLSFGGAGVGFRCVYDM